MQGLNDFISLKALFNKELSEAVENKSYNRIREISWRDYAEDIEEGSVKIEEIDVDYIYNEFQKSLEVVDKINKLY